MPGVHGVFDKAVQVVQGCGRLRAVGADQWAVIGLIEAEGRKAVALPADIRDEKAARQVVDDAVKALGGLEVLVLNAGMQQSQDSIADITLSWSRPRCPAWSTR